MGQSSDLIDGYYYQYCQKGLVINMFNIFENDVKDSCW